MSSRERHSDNPAFLLLKALITGQKIFYATSDGNINKKTIVCSGLTSIPDQDGNQIHIVDPNSGSKDQTRDVTGATTGGTVNVNDAFDAQITEGTAFILTGIRSTPVELAAFETWVKTAIGDASGHTLTSLVTKWGDASASLATTILDGIDGRTNTKTLHGLLGIPDDSGKAIYTNIGDFQAQTHLQTLLAALGIPDTSGKPLYTCLVTDRLDNATYGLSAIEGLVDDLETRLTAARGGYLDILNSDSKYILSTALTAPSVNSLVSFIASGGVGLGRALPDSTSLIDLLGNFTGPYNGIAQDDNIKASLDLAHTDLDTIITDIGALNNITAANVWELNISAYAGAGYAGTYLKMLYDDWINGGRLDLLLDACSTHSPVNVRQSVCLTGDTANSIGKILYEFYINRLTATRAGYLDELDFDLNARLDTKVAGKQQIAKTTEDLNQVAGTYDLFTGTTQDVLLESLLIRMPNIVAGGAITSVSIQTDDATPQVLLSAADGVVANLTAEAQLAWQNFSAPILIKVGKKVQLTIAGGAHGIAYVCDIVVKVRAVTSGGYLA